MYDIVKTSTNEHFFRKKKLVIKRVFEELKEKLVNTSNWGGGKYIFRHFFKTTVCFPSGLVLFMDHVN